MGKRAEAGSRSIEKGRKVRLYFRGDAAFASPEMCEYLEAEGFLYAIRVPAKKNAPGEHRAFPDAPCWPSAQSCAALLR